MSQLNEKIEYTKCCYCGRKFDESTMLTKTREHFYPRSRGGLGCGINILFSCHECNTWKAAMMPEDFFVIVKKHCDLKRLRGTYELKNIERMRSNLSHWIRYMKNKKISEYSY